jgi:hypothetical protein
VSIAWTAQESGTRRVPGGAVVWRTFLRGLAIELDAQAGPERTVHLLRGAGQQMAGLLGLPAVGSLGALELEMNAVLTEIGWGSVRLSLSETERCVLLSHTDLPQIGSAADPPGTWLAPALEGLYQGWMSQQPGADASLQARARDHNGDTIVICYGR